jgi:hypothetical protein
MKFKAFGVNSIERDCYNFMPKKKDFDTVKVLLTQTPVNYTGTHDHMEITAHSPDIHAEPGLYLQRVEGCGYTVTELTLSEARRIAQALNNAADWAEKQNWGKVKV